MMSPLLTLELPLKTESPFQEQQSSMFLSDLERFSCQWCCKRGRFGDQACIFWYAPFCSLHSSCTKGKYPSIFVYFLYHLLLIIKKQNILVALESSRKRLCRTATTLSHLSTYTRCWFKISWRPFQYIVGNACINACLLTWFFTT